MGSPTVGYPFAKFRYFRGGQYEIEHAPPSPPVDEPVALPGGADSLSPTPLERPLSQRRPFARCDLSAFAYSTAPVFHRFKECSFLI